MSTVRSGPPAPTSAKSSQLFIRDYPHRAIAITTSTHALIFRYSPTTNEAILNGSLASVSSARARSTSDGLVSKCMVEFSPITRDLLSEFRPLTPRPIYGTLGLIAINQDVFLCVVTHATRVASLRPGETVERIVSVDFFCLNSADYDQISLSTWDNNFDDSFLWNSYMISPLLKFRSRLMTHEPAPLRASKTGLPSFLTVISRLSCKRAGTRFNSRGIDDDGNVANFVETETIYWSPSGVLFSYAQVRGSVPVFWEQTAGLIPGQQKISITRSADGTQPAFDKHFEELEQSYGAVHIVNLLSATKPGEAELSQLFHYGVQHCPLNRLGEKQSADHALLRETDYDFHAETKVAGYEAAREIRRYIEHSAEGFAYYLAEETDDSADMLNESNEGHRMVVVLQQEDLLLGRLVGQSPVYLYDPISEFVSTELGKRSSEYSSTEPITIWAGTFNLNGRTNGMNDDLSSWIWPAELGSTQPEIMVVGFQEIVELSAQQIMNSDPTRKQAWERAIKQTLNRKAKEIGGEKYVLLRSGQLVGAALCIFVKASSLPKIKNVEGSVKKTGMSGIAGNKGAVSIHTVIWLGDFNYRIGLSHDTAMDLIKKQDLEKLYENDQVRLYS
ncbi:putative synaptojanin 2 protein [Eutypa lata UCREL1]|uniref:phosphoinositide 5-phosphatase n=1 Tax=Eutypa lata (strain UCR-EL1) TaxID=1287681 RepID=M7S7I1_EUTLA|nr:putative synaptojanin 2 protein [Eutypa lata UCREL1]